MASAVSLKCPECGADRLFKAGLRYLADGSSTQRWLCRECGYRFSEDSWKNLNFQSADRGNRQISAILKGDAKNLDYATKAKIVAGEKENKLPQVTRGLLAKYAAYLEREGFYNETSYYGLIKSLANSGADLLDPEDVKEKIAKHRYTGKDGKNRQWRQSTKMLAVYAYDAFCKMEGLTWTRPKYKQEETILLVPDEKILDALIIYSRSKRTTAFLQCLKETYADPGEILALEWKEIKDNIITIAHPVKGHLPGQYKVSIRLISMLNALPKTDKRVFPATYRALSSSLESLKRRVARKMHNPAVLDVTFKSYRHWGGSMIAHYTNGNVLTVKKMLRHKTILSTMKYIHTINFAESDFQETVATTPEEIRKCGKEGWTKYDEITVNGVQMHFYRKPKRFSGLQ